MAWKLEFHSERLERELAAMPPGLLARLLRYAERLEVFGPDLGMPHTRAMGDGLFELRIKAAEGIARVFYCTAAERRVILLHWFVKKTDKTPARELAVAIRRMKEVRHE